MSPAWYRVASVIERRTTRMGRANRRSLFTDRRGMGSAGRRGVGPARWSSGSIGPALRSFQDLDYLQVADSIDEVVERLAREQPWLADRAE
jgi:hypothetical protein